MQQSIFLINNRFAVEKTKNEVWDKEKGEKHRLEPRLMKLLCLLTLHPAEVVTRETMLKEIWDNYPGANEGLNQAISFLRKLLGDEQKEIIVTLPKKGYIFNGVISHTSTVGALKDKSIPLKFALPLTAALIVFIIAWNYYPRTSQSGGQTPEQLRILSNIDAQRDSTRYNNDSTTFKNNDSINFVHDDSVNFRHDSMHHASIMK